MNVHHVVVHLQYHPVLTHALASRQIEGVHFYFDFFLPAKSGGGRIQFEKVSRQDGGVRIQFENVSRQDGGVRIQFEKISRQDGQTADATPRRRRHRHSYYAVHHGDEVNVIRR